MTKVMQVDYSKFSQAVNTAKKPLVVELWAPSCKACFAVSPIVRELATEYRGKVDFVRVNVDKNPDVASDYGIMSLPALLVFDGGNLVERIVGLRPKEQLKRLVNSSVPAGLGV